MAKKQRSILKCIKDGVTIDFERFTYKTAEKIIKEYKKTFKPKDFNNFFFKEYKKADCIRIISTPNGYEDEESVVLKEYTPDEFFKAITREEAA